MTKPSSAFSTKLTLSKVVVNFRCSELTKETYPTHGMFERFCIPSKGALLDKISETFSSMNIETIFENIGTTKNLILISILISFIAAYVFSFFLEHCAGVIVFATLIGFYVGVIFLNYILYQRWMTHKAASEKDPKDEIAKKNMKLFKFFFWALVCFICLTLCFLLCFFNRLLLSIMIIQVIIFE